MVADLGHNPHLGPCTLPVRNMLLSGYVHTVLWQRDQWTPGKNSTVSASKGSISFGSIHGGSVFAVITS